MRISEYNGDWTHDWERYSAFSRMLHQRAGRVEDAIRREAKRLSVEAGLDPNLLGVHPHNAMVSRTHGKPWPGVDYAKVRRILWLMDTKICRPRNYVRQILDRHYDRIVELQRRRAV